MNSNINNMDNINNIDNNNNLIEYDGWLVSKDLLDNQIISFDDIEELKENILRGIIINGFEYPSNLQGLVFKSLITNKKDMLIQAVGGTGKTTAALITALQLIDENLNKPQILFLNPVNEYCVYCNESIKKIGFEYPEDNYLIAMGGIPVNDNINKLGGEVNDVKCENVAKIVFGTPGRINHLLETNSSLFDSIKLVVFDECDELLNGPFTENCLNILSKLQNKPQLLMITNTLTNETKNVLDGLLDNPLKIIYKRENLILDLAKQTYIVSKEPKQAIVDILKLSFSKFIIYVNSDKQVKEIGKYLKENDLNIIEINSKTDKTEINNIFDSFNNTLNNGIVSTDKILLNSINLSKINLIINFGLPNKNKINIYFHRIGRKYRFCRERLLINVIEDESDLEQIKTIENTFKTTITEFKPDDLQYINR